MVHKTKNKYVSFGRDGYANFDGELGNFQIRMKDGRTLSVFFNKDRNLFVADVLNKRATGGNEFIRMDVSKVKT